MNSAETFLRRAHSLAQEFAECRIISLEPGNIQEQILCGRLKESIAPSEIVPVHTLAELCSALDGASFVLTERYHGALAAFARGIPVEIIPQAQGDKLSALQSLMVENHERSRMDVHLRELVQSGEDALRVAMMS